MEADNLLYQYKYRTFIKDSKYSKLMMWITDIEPISCPEACWVTTLRIFKPARGAEEAIIIYPNEMNYAFTESFLARHQP